MTGYPLNSLFEEVAYLSYYFHWPYEQIMGLEHRERQRWIAELAKINQELNQVAESQGYGAR
jgi:hypothetical protein